LSASSQNSGVFMAISLHSEVLLSEECSTHAHTAKYRVITNDLYTLKVVFQNTVNYSKQ